MACLGQPLPFPWLPHAEWAQAVLLAHRVFGTMTLCAMVCWSLALTRQLRLGAAFFAAGGSTFVCGAWLLLWTLLLVAPAASLEQRVDFAWRDLAQEQHVAVALLLCGAGAAEMFHALALAAALPPRRWPHTVWFANMAMVGMLFVTHPQRTWSETQRHVALGLSLIAGAFTLTCEKNEGLLDGEQDVLEAPNIALAALSFGIAAILLFTFPPPDGGSTATNSPDTPQNLSISLSTPQNLSISLPAPQNLSTALPTPQNLSKLSPSPQILSISFTPHVGVSTHCQQGHPVAAAAVVVSLVSFVVIFAAAVWDAAELRAALHVIIRRVSRGCRAFTQSHQTCPHEDRSCSSIASSRTKCSRSLSSVEHITELQLLASAAPAGSDNELLDGSKHA
ncbi:hypothetical protein AB1Y20_013366 [Prymnesium parvum]|uniref:Transmembrane protein 107 n=1 Tax=Prymnesium parvum TaxID=97485 RepID=A0AB34IFK4_PRYPA